LRTDVFDVRVTSDVMPVAFGVTVANPARHADASRRRTAWRPLAVAVTGGALLMTAGFGVWASLDATAFNETPQDVSSGTLSLSLADNGAGFTSTITNIAPGDVVNRYVDLTNDGNLAAKALTLAVDSTGSDGVLVTDGATSKALRVTVKSCAVAWDHTAGTCASGTPTSLLAATPLSGLTSAQSLISGAIAVNETEHLLVAVSLPDQSETTINGTLPTGTVQNKSATLTYTFQESQRDGLTTNS
jgi:hypothetical protein